MPSFESSESRRNVPPPEPVSEETRAKLLKRDREEISGVRKKPHSADRAEYVSAREIPRAAQPEVVHHMEKVRVRTPEQVEAEKTDRERANLLVEQIKNEPYLQQFETAAQQSAWQAHTEMGKLRDLMNGGATRGEVEEARQKLIPLLTYLREQLQPYGLKMPPGEKTSQAMEAIHQSIVGIGEALYESDRYLRREQRIVEREGGDYSMLSQNPELRKRQELWGQYTEKARQEKRKKKEGTGWSRFTSGVKTFFGLK